MGKRTWMPFLCQYLGTGLITRFRCVRLDPLCSQPTILVPGQNILLFRYMFQLFGNGNKNKRKRAWPDWTEPICSAEQRRLSPRPRSCKISHFLLCFIGNESPTSSSGTIWGFLRFCCCSFHALFNKSPLWVNLCRFKRSESARGHNGEEDPGSTRWRGLWPEKNLQMYLAYFEECDGTFLSFLSVNTGERTKALTARALLLSFSWKLCVASARVPRWLTLTSARRPLFEKTPNFWDVEKALGRAGRGAFDELQEMRDRPRYQRQKNTPPNQDSVQNSSSVGEMWKKWWANKAWQSSAHFNPAFMLFTEGQGRTGSTHHRLIRLFAFFPTEHSRFISRYCQQIQERFSNSSATTNMNVSSAFLHKVSTAD